MFISYREMKVLSRSI